MFNSELKKRVEELETDLASLSLTDLSEMARKMVNSRVDNKTCELSYRISEVGDQHGRDIRQINTRLSKLEETIKDLAEVIRTPKAKKLEDLYTLTVMDLRDGKQYVEMSSKSVVFKDGGHLRYVSSKCSVGISIDMRFREVKDA